MRPTRFKTTMLWAVLAVLLVFEYPICGGSTSIPTRDEAETPRPAPVHSKKEYNGYVNDLCPPIKRGTHDFVTLGMAYPPAGGCIATSPRADMPVSFFEVWISNFGSCNKLGSMKMDYFQYDCVSKWTQPSIDGKRNWTFVMLKDMVAAQSLEDEAFHCSVYESTVKTSKYNTDSTLFRIAISESVECAGLINKLESPPKWNSYTAKRVAATDSNDGIVTLLLPLENVNLVRVPRHAEASEPAPVTYGTNPGSMDVGCRFPDWMQGVWTDINVDSSVMSYAKVTLVEEEADAVTEIGYRVMNKRSLKTTKASRVKRSAEANPSPFFLWDKIKELFGIGVPDPNWSTESPQPVVISTVHYKQQRDYAMDTGIRFDNYNDPMNTKKEFQDRKKRSADPDPLCVWEKIKKMFGIGVPDPNWSTVSPAPVEISTVPYKQQRDYEMDTAARFNRYNNPFNTKKEFEDRRKKREINNYEPNKILREINRLRTVDGQMHFPLRYSRDLSRSYSEKNTMHLQKDNTDKIREKRSTNQEQIINNFQWRCIMPMQKEDTKMENDEFLVFGGRSNTGHIQMTDGPNNENLTDIRDDMTSSYACLRVKSHGLNVMEFAVTGAGKYNKQENSVTGLASKLCGKKSNEKKRQRKWMTVARKLENERRPVTCPILPGMVFIGKTPTPPLPESSGDSSNPPTQLCAKLVSMADDCTSGQPGSEDRMRFTISECIDQDLPGSPPKILNSEPNEDHEYQCLGVWTETQNITDAEGKQISFTYVYTKRLNPRVPGSNEYDCFVGTTIPNHPDMSEYNITITMMMTSAGTGTECSRLADPFSSGMKMIGTYVKTPGGNRRQQSNGGNRPAENGTNHSAYINVLLILFSTVLLGAVGI